MSDHKKRTGWCCVPKCSTNSKKNTEKNCVFYRFPKDADRSLEWVLNSGRKDLLLKDAVYRFTNYKVCGIHFEKKMYHSLLTKKLRKDAVPTIFGEAATVSQTSIVKKQKVDGHQRPLPSNTVASTSGKEVDDHVDDSLVATYLQYSKSIPVSAEQRQKNELPLSDIKMSHMFSSAPLENTLLSATNTEQNAMPPDPDASVNEPSFQPLTEDPVRLPRNIEEKNFVYYSIGEVNQNYKPQSTELNIAKREQSAVILLPPFETASETQKIEIKYS